MESRNSMNQKNWNNNIDTFIELVRAGLWEKEARLLQFGVVDYEEVMRIAEEQSVVGLVTAGLEQVKDVKVPQETLLQFIGQSLQLEQRINLLPSWWKRCVLLTLKLYWLRDKGLRNAMKNRCGGRAEMWTCF